MKTAAAWLAPARCMVPVDAPVRALLEVVAEEARVIEGPTVQPKSAHIAMHQLEWLLLQFVGLLIPGSPVLHAACVKLFDQVVVIVAPSGGGKSTLCLATLALGGLYVTDDVVSLLPGRVSGFARSIRFKDYPAKALPAEPWLAKMDTQSFRHSLSGLERIVPIFSGDHRPVSSIPLVDEVVVVQLIRGSDEIVELSNLERVVLLHEAAIARWGEYNGALGAGPTFRLSWRNPDRAAELLARRLSS